MAKKISALNEPTVNPYDLDNLFALGYEKDKDKLTNVQINQRGLRDAILSNISNAIYTSSDDGSTNITLKDKIDALYNELSALSTTTGANIDDIRAKLSSIFTDENISDEDIMSFINEGKKYSASSIEIFKAIIEKIKELHENQIDDDEPSSPSVIDTTEIENEIAKLRNVIGLNADIICPDKPFDTLDNFSPEEGSAENDYNIAAKKYNDTLAKYAIVSLGDYSKKGIINISAIASVNTSINGISDYFNIDNISIDSSNEYIDYSKISEQIDNSIITLNDINNVCDIIPLFYNKEDSSENSEETDTYIRQLNNITEELANIDAYNFITYGYPSIIVELLNDISNDYTKITNNLNKSKWTTINSIKENLDALIEDLKSLLNLEDDDSIDFDLVKEKIGTFTESLKNNFSKISSSDETLLEQLPEKTKNQRDAIASNLGAVSQLIENLDIYELEGLLCTYYDEVKTEFSTLTTIPENIEEGKIKDNAQIKKVRDLLFDSDDDYNDYGFDIKDRSSSYIRSEIDSIKEYWSSTGKFNKTSVEFYFGHVKNIIASKSFVTPTAKNTEGTENIFDNFFNDLKICLDTYGCYWTSEEDKSEIFIEINKKLNDIELLEFINVTKEDGTYLNKKIEISSTDIIDDKAEIIKNNLIKLGDSISGGTGVTKNELEEELNDELTPIKANITDINADITGIEADITNIEADITDIEGNISTIKKRLDIEVPGRINAESDKILNNLEPKINSNSNLLAENTTKLNHLSDNIQNYAGFINYNDICNEIETDLEQIIVEGKVYYKYKTPESGILYITKGESNFIKFIPYTNLVEDENGKYSLNEFYKSLYCPEEGLNVPFISINLLKGNGIIFPSDINQKLYFIPYLTATEIDDIIKGQLT